MKKIKSEYLHSHYRSLEILTIKCVRKISHQMLFVKKTLFAQANCWLIHKIYVKIRTLFVTRDDFFLASNNIYTTSRSRIASSNLQFYSPLLSHLVTVSLLCGWKFQLCARSLLSARQLELLQWREDKLHERIFLIHAKSLLLFEIFTLF